MAAKNGSKIKLVSESRPIPRYHFPRECLEQDYFTKTGDGRRLEASLALDMLADKHFVSPLEYLLRQLAADGYDVSACEAEYKAMREHVFNQSNNLDALNQIITDLLNHRPSASLMTIRHQKEDKLRRDRQSEKWFRKEFPVIARRLSHG